MVFFVLLCSARAEPLTPDEVLKGRRDNSVLVRPRRDPLAGREIQELSARAKVGARVEKKFPALGGIQILKIPKGGDLGKAMAELRASGAYEYVEPDFVVHADNSPNDPDFTSGAQWGLHNTGQNSGVADADIDAPEGWDARTDATTAIIAVIDSGVRYTHEDLATNMWRNPGESGDGKETNGIDDDGNGYVDDVFGINAITNSGNPMDDNGHGTHVSGTAGAVGNNGKGGSGVAWNARIMACKFLASNGSGAISDAIKCIEYARLRGAKVMNNSWGGGGFSQSVLDAIRVAGDAGVLFVAAAGNSKADLATTDSYPASYQAENVLAVAGTARNDGLYSETSYGFGIVDIAAPGQEIQSTYNSSDSAYGLMSGTSMATPHVSGAAALLRTQFPSDTPRQTINRLLRSTRPIAALAGKTTRGGVLNLADALATTLATPFNDAFADACAIPGFPAIVRSSNANATSEAGEPSHAGVAPAATIWYRWTATKTGQIQVKTTGSAFNTVLAVYTGNALDGLVEVASNDNDSSLTTSLLNFQATLNTAYYIAVGGKTPTDTGLVLLNLSDAPAAPTPPGNDNFANRQTITGDSNLVVADNKNATSESGETLNTIDSGGHSVWWEWTAPRDGRVEVVTEWSDFDTTVGIYTGTAVDALTPVDRNDDVIGGIVRTSRTVFKAQSGQKYQISVDGWSTETGSVFLWLTQGSPPVNDAFASASDFPSPAATQSGGNATVRADTNFATKEPGEPIHAGLNGISSVWWKWTAPVSGNVTLDGTGSDFYEVISVYRGDAVNSLTLVAEDAPDSTHSRVVFAATVGQTYRIAVDGYERSAGNASLQLSIENSRPSVSAALLSLGTPLFDDQQVSVASATAADPEQDPFTIRYQWQSSPDGSTYTDAAGETASTLSPAASRSGLFWRCNVSAADALGAGSAFSTTAFPLDNRPPSLARDGQAFSYDCDLPGTGDFAFLSGSEVSPGLTLNATTGVLSGTINCPSGGLFRVKIGRGSLERTFDLLVGTSAGVYRVPTGRTWTPSGSVTVEGILLIEGSLAPDAQVAVVPSYSSWRAAYFGTPAGPEISGDPDGDGMVDLLEFAFGGNPLVSDSPSRLPFAGTTSDSPGYATITFRRQVAPSTTSYLVERSSNLSTWTTVDPVAHAVGSATPDGVGFEWLTVRDSEPLSSTPSFLRIRVRLAP